MLSLGAPNNPLAGNPSADALGTGGSARLDPQQLAEIAGIYTGIQSTLTTATGVADAAGLAATGATAEANAYGTAADIGTESAKIAGISGEIATYQQQLEVSRKLGGARAAYGASGAAFSGSALDIMRASLQQGALGAQLIGVQTTLSRAGYEEAAMASTAEEAAANAQADASRAQQSVYSTEAAQASQELADLKSRYGSIDDLEREARATAAPKPGFQSVDQNAPGYVGYYT